jgi:serine/threonine protein kinase
MQRPENLDFTEILTSHEPAAAHWHSHYGSSYLLHRHLLPHRTCSRIGTGTGTWATVGSSTTTMGSANAKETISATSKRKSAAVSCAVATKRQRMEREKGARSCPVLGFGMAGTVYAVHGTAFPLTEQLRGCYYALKVCTEQQEDTTARNDNELQILRACSHHPFVITLVHAHRTQGEMHLLMEMGIMNFHELALRYPRGVMPTEAVRFHASCAVLALEELHGNLGVVHGDVKLGNMLLGVDGYLRLCDFGTAVRVGGVDGQVHVAHYTGSE